MPDEKGRQPAARPGRNRRKKLHQQHGWEEDSQLQQRRGHTIHDSFQLNPARCTSQKPQCQCSTSSKPIESAPTYTHTQKQPTPSIYTQWVDYIYHARRQCRSPATFTLKSVNLRSTLQLELGQCSWCTPRRLGTRQLLEL